MRTIPFGRPWITQDEVQAVQAVLEGPMLTHGPRVKEFERVFAQYTGAPHAVATSSCTAAMHLAYLAAGIGPGDQVIVPSQTHVATAHAVEYCGATPVFVDAEPRSGNLDIQQLESLIGPRTKALAVVHYLGMPVAMDRVLEFASKHKLFVVEDCALALGTTRAGQHAGTFGDVGCFSFYPVKHITTAEGGMLITRRAELARKIASLRAFGIDRNVVTEREVPGLYDVPLLGLNYRMTELEAGLGLAQMKKLPLALEKRRENFWSLRRALAGLDEIAHLQSSTGEDISSYYCLAAVLREDWIRRRNPLIKALAARGVQTSIYYPHPVPRLAYYREKYGYEPHKFPVANMLSDAAIALSVGPHLALDDMKYIAGEIKNALPTLK